jgi:hypothetical protein
VKLVRRSFIEPECAATHSHWFVKLWVEWAILVFLNRAKLRKPIRDLHGHVLVRAMPEWYIRPKKGETTAQLEKRRADWTQNRLAVMLILIAHMDFRSKTVVPSPDSPEYMTMVQVAAQLPGMKCADPVDAVERAFAFLKLIGFFSYIKQCRQKLENGSFRSWGGALRRIGTEWMFSLGGMIAGGLSRLQAWIKEQDRKADAKQAAADEAFTEQLARRREPLIVLPRAAVPAIEAEQAAADTDAPFIAQVELEHPDWIERTDIAAIRAEVRRLRLEAAAARERPDDTS